MIPHGGLFFSRLAAPARVLGLRGAEWSGGRRTADSEPLFALAVKKLLWHVVGQQLD